MWQGQTRTQAWPGFCRPRHPTAGLDLLHRQHTTENNVHATLHAAAVTPPFRRVDRPRRQGATPRLLERPVEKPRLVERLIDRPADIGEFLAQPIFFLPREFSESRRIRAGVDHEQLAARFEDAVGFLQGFQLRGQIRHAAEINHRRESLRS